MKKKENKNQFEYAAIIAVNTEITSTTAKQTNIYNTECIQYRTSLADEAASNAELLNKKLANNIYYDGSRYKAVSTAYKYEVADIKMGGKGSANWNKSECQELVRTGKVRGYEGHHINSVARHPSQQTDPNNIRFYRSHNEHKDEGHAGNFRNPSSGELIDRDKMLKVTNAKRVAVNEAKGAATAIVVGASFGVVSSVVETCKEEGTSFSSIKKGLKQSAKPAFISAACSLTTYIVTRTLKHYFN